MVVENEFKGMENGWFSEKEVLWPGQKFSLKVEKVLFHEKSTFQDILVFESSTYGRVLVLDGVIQLTERDEYAYQEMITHLPIMAHENPKKVLIVGGGDGGVLREVARHTNIEQITMCEIDPMVCEVSKKYFSETMATSFNDSRLNLIHDDAAAFLRKDNQEKYDVIIVDSSDPVGPAESLYQSEFYESLRHSLTSNGIICTQGECIWLHLDLIENLLKRCGLTFNKVDYAYTTIPTYPSGQIGFVLASVNSSKDYSLRHTANPIPMELQNQLKYYSKDIHQAAFTLPKFAQEKLQDYRK